MIKIAIIIKIANVRLFCKKLISIIVSSKQFYYGFYDQHPEEMEF